MNAADRSIALVDAAMRRRFYFVEFFPRRSPIDGLLRRWLVREGLPAEPADLLAELNRRIDDEDFGIAPSYLMSGRIADPGWLERVWHRAVLPLLEEHYYGTGRRVEEEFGLPALRRAIRDERLAEATVPADGTGLDGSALGEANDTLPAADAT